jgi:cysteinyl-tRNA synthetase
MAEKHLGVGFDIHGGGLDLRFPHHENELAQSRGAGRPFARTWMHNGMIELGAEKMSKSIGNIVSLREALDRWGREAVLVFFLGGHYRSALQYSDVTMQAARAQADDFCQAFRVAAARPSDLTWNRFADALDDDFDTPRALAVLHGWRAAGQLDLLARGLGVFGLAIDTAGAVAPPAALRLVEARRAARARRDYAEADRLRAEIEQLGWELQDGADGFRLIPKVRP